MKDKTLVDKFKDFVDGYKIAKIDALIKKTKLDLGKITTGIEAFDLKCSNALEPVNLGDIQFRLLKIYDIDLSKDFAEWNDYQKSSEYTSQSLRTKIVNKVKKVLSDYDTKEEVNKILDNYKLNYNLDLSFKIIKQGLSDELLQVIEKRKINWLQKLNDINEKYDYSNWLDWASSNAKNISFATHIAKLTHSGISGASNVFFNEFGNQNCLSTTSLKNRKIEVSQSNNSLAPIGKLLQLRSNNELLSKNIKSDKFTIFESFAKNDEQLSQWRKGFAAIFVEKDLATHYLAKQIYFPVNNNYHCDFKNYHLINPMMSSSLDQEIFTKVNFVKYSKESVEIREQKREGLYHQNIQMSYPNIAILKVTSGDKKSRAHMNVSPLNIERIGGRYLFPSTPPTWQAIQKPPLNQKSMFSGEFEKRAWKTTEKLQKYLIKLQTKEFGNKAIRDQVKQHINDVISILFNYVLDIQSMSAGWSEKSKLTEAHALWLDNNRNNQSFQEKRKSGQWQNDICQDFGVWINSKLSNKEMKLVKFEKDKWAKFLRNRLSLFDKGWEKT